MSDYETGKARPRLREIAVLAMVYGRPIEQLMPEFAAELRAALAARLESLPDCSQRWLGRFNRQNTLNALAGRLEMLSSERL